MRAWFAWAVGIVTLSQWPILGCSSSPSSNDTAAPMQLRGAYRTTGDGAIRQITFGDRSRYFLWRSPCAAGQKPEPGAHRCRESGSFALNDARTELSLTNEGTGQTTAMPFHALQADGPALRTQGLVNGEGDSLVHDQTPLISSFEAGSQNFQAEGCKVGVDAAQRARENVGKRACDTTSTGEHAFGSSCTGNGGSPEEWCADFAKWVWGSLGVDVGGLTAAAGSFYVYGQNHGTLSDKPHVGDAVVFNYNGSGYADHVALVSFVNEDGTIESISGNWNGPNGPSTSQVMVNAPAYSGTVDSSSSTMGGYQISGFISPACNSQ